MDEIWKQIEDTGYFVSNLGVIQGPRRVLKQRFNSGGYLIVCIWRKDGTRFTRPVHRIVCDAFLGPKPLGRERNHKDGNKLNNQLDNLEFLTPSQNQIHGLSNHLIPSGEKHYKAKLTLAQVEVIRKSDETAKNLGAMYGVGKCAIDRIRNGKSWKHYPAAKLRERAEGSSVSEAGE